MFAKWYNTCVRKCRGKIMARECIVNDYGMCLNRTGILQSHSAQSVRQRSNIEYCAHH